MYDLCGFYIKESIRIKDLMITFEIMERKNKVRLKLGVAIVILSILLFLFLPIIPFLNMDSKTKVTVSTVVFISAEVTFYGGGFLVGKELFSKYKSYFNPKNWFNNRQKDDNINNLKGD